MLGMRLTAKMALSPNLKTSLCLSRGKVDANAFWAAEAAGPCGSHIPDTQHPMMLLKCGPRAFLTVFAQDLRAWWLASRTRLSLSWCEREMGSKWAELTREQPCDQKVAYFSLQIFSAVCLFRSEKPQHLPVVTFRTMATGMWSGCGRWLQTQSQQVYKIQNLSWGRVVGQGVGQPPHTLPSDQCFPSRCSLLKLNPV